MCNRITREEERGKTVSDYTQREHDSAEDTQKGRFLTFVIGDATYGIEMFFIREIVGLRTITEMPEMPEYVSGIINLRGAIIPVIDVRLRFGKEKRTYTDRTCVIVVKISDRSVGLIVDSVSEVLSIPAEEVTGVPVTGHGHDSRFIKNIGKNIGKNTGGVVMIVDCDKLLDKKESENLNEIS
jgi:purine-binding chemotaxis protein CheW